jgi:peptidyl-prolyl cis-trans isomerase D
MAEQFTNLVYEQSESLKPVVDKLGLKIETAAGLTRTPNPAAAPTALYNNPKFLSALFSDEAIKNKRNTEAIEVAPSTLIAGRVLEHKPVAKRPFEEVQAVVRERVIQEEAAALAKKAGEAKLAAAKSGDSAGFGEAKTVSRTKAQGVNQAALPSIMKTDATKLPAYVGVDLGAQGYGVYKITKVGQPANPDTARRAAEQQQIAGTLAQQEAFAYLEVLKKKAKVEILKPVAAKKPETEGN